MRQFRGNVAPKCQFLTGFALLVAWFATGCDECSPGASRCKGDSYSYCHTNEDGYAIATWHDSPCAVTCREADGKAACVDTRAPIPECAGGEDDICLDDVPTSCFGGYPIRGPLCGGGTHCFAGSLCGGDRGQPTAICAVDANAPPNCSAGSACYGSELITCECGFVTARQDCGAADLCRTVGPRMRCTATVAPDPRCGDPTQTWSMFCEDNKATTCGYGYPETTIDCTPAGYTCEVTGRNASCQDPNAGP